MYVCSLTCQARGANTYCSWFLFCHLSFGAATRILVYICRPDDGIFKSSNTTTGEGNNFIVWWWHTTVTTTGWEAAISTNSPWDHLTVIILKPKFCHLETLQWRQCLYVHALNGNHIPILVLIVPKLAVLIRNSVHIHPRDIQYLSTEHSTCSSSYQWWNLWNFSASGQNTIAFCARPHTAKWWTYWSQITASLPTLWSAYPTSAYKGS